MKPKIFLYLIRYAINPVTFISIFGPVLAYRLSVLFSDYNDLILSEKNPFGIFSQHISGFLDFQIQAYTVILAFSVSFLIFFKIIIKDFSTLRISNFLKEIDSKTNYQMFYILSMVVLIMGIMIILLFMQNPSIVEQYINYNKDFPSHQYFVHFPPFKSPLTWYRMLLAIYGLTLEYYTTKGNRQ